MAILAYVDPGTGLLAWQAIVAAFVGAFFYVKKTRDWVFGLFRKCVPGRPKTPGRPCKPLRGEDRFPTAGA